jgi:phenylacetate-CoA ligase
MIRLSSLADALRRAGQRSLGRELDRARFVHWVEQWYPAWLIAERQRERLSELVAYARVHSSFYRERLAGLPADFDLAAYAQVPPLTREELLRDAKAVRCGTAWGARASGGTGGRGLRVPVDRRTYAWYIAGTWRGLRWWDTDFTERSAILLGPGHRGILGVAARAKDWVMNWLRLPVDGRFDERAPQLLQRIRAFGPAFLYAFPSAAHRLARAVLEGDARPPAGLKVVVVTGEMFYAFQRREIEEAFGCPVAQEYGSGEVGSMAFQCGAGVLHVTAENVYLEEAFDPQLPEGKRLLVTQLHNRLFPILRYEIGDVGTIEDAPCSCGRALPVVRVFGRLRDLLGAAGERHFAYPVLDRLFELLPHHLRGRVRIRQRERAQLTAEVDGGSDPDLIRVRDLLKDLLGPGWRVDAGRAPIRRLPSGKVAYFVQDHAEPLSH